MRRLKSHIVIVIVIVISKLLKRYSKAKRTRAPAYSRGLRRIKGGFQRGVKRSSGPNSRVPGGDRVAVRVGVIEMGRGKSRIPKDSVTMTFYFIAVNTSKKYSSELTDVGL